MRKTPTEFHQNIEVEIQKFRLCLIYSNLWDFPDYNSTIRAARNNVFAAWTESTSDNTGRMSDAGTYLDCCLIVP